MAQHRHLFVMDSIENLNLKLDSSLRMALALIRLGHECYMTTISEISWQMIAGRESIAIDARKLEEGLGDTPAILERTISLDGRSLDAVHMRKDPPFNMEYLSSTWLLSALEKSCKIYNAPGALRDKNEKLIIFDYPQHIHSALVSNQLEKMAIFILEQCQGDGIVKPLDLYGGRGVERIKAGTLAETQEKLKQLTQNDGQTRIIQPFDQSIYKGEVRVFTAGGKIISWCLKVPAKGEYLANTRAGASLLAHSPSPEEISMVEEVSADLLTKGIFLVGYDLIGGKISEINITSPRLLLPENINSKPYYDEMAKLVEADL